MTKAISKNQIVQLENAQYMLHKATHEMRWDEVDQDEINGTIDDALNVLNEVLEALSISEATAN